MTIPRNPGRLNRLVLAVTASAHASAAALTGVAALSPGLRTPPLPATHAWVGYGWQNSQLYHSFKVQQLPEQPRVAPRAVGRPAYKSRMTAPETSETWDYSTILSHAVFGAVKFVLPAERYPVFLVRCKDRKRSAWLTRQFFLESPPSPASSFSRALRT